MIDIDGDAVLEEIISQHGIFAQQAHRLYSFSHLTFQEYYTAKYIADDKSADSQAILPEHILNDKWREVALMTASLLPDATFFLDGYADALLRTAASNLPLTRTIRSVDEAAVISMAGFSRTATRLFYLFNGYSKYTDRVNLSSNRQRQFAVASCLINLANIASGSDKSDKFEISLHLALVNGFVHNNLFALAFRLDRRLARAFAHKLAVNLASGVPTATPGAASEQKTDKAMRSLRWFARSVESSWELSQFHRLQTEADIVERQLSPQIEQVRSDRAFDYYCRATRLFYDCIQLANVPDRRAFEKRILEPPP